MGKARTASGIYNSTFQINNGKLAQSMRMSLPAALVRSLGLMKGMTAYLKVHADGTFTVYPNKPPDTQRQHYE
jgi:antitoxin component of MazEF toxin-antitoxin module